MKAEDKKLIVIRISEDLKNKFLKALEKNDEKITEFLKACIKDYVKKNS